MGVAPHAREDRVGDKVDRVRRARVLGLLVGVVVGHARLRVVDDVFQDRAEALRRGVDLRLRFLVDADRLGVAAALEVEDAALTPAVLVVADEPARRVRRQRRLAGAAQPEEKRHVGAVLLGVGRAVHRKHILGGQQVVERDEDRLLDLAGVTRTADEHDAAPEVDQDERLALRAVAGGVSLHRRQRDDREIRLEAQMLFGVGPDEEVAREQAVPRHLGDHAHPQPEARVGAREHVLRVDGLRLDELFHARQKAVELRGRYGLVARVPPDGVLAGRLLDEELVLRRPARVLAGLGGQGSGGDDCRLIPANRLFVKGGGTEIAPFDGNLTLRDHDLNATTRCARVGRWPAAAACRSRSRPGCTRRAGPARRRTRDPC